MPSSTHHGVPAPLVDLPVCSGHAFHAADRGHRMKTNMLVRARQHFACGIKHIDRHNQRAWVRSLRYLGDKWLLATAVQKVGGKAA